jgi:hypothetical protein
MKLALVPPIITREKPKWDEKTSLSGNKIETPPGGFCLFSQVAFYRLPLSKTPTSLNRRCTPTSPDFDSIREVHE